MIKYDTQFVLRYSCQFQLLFKDWIASKIKVLVPVQPISELKLMIYAISMSIRIKGNDRVPTAPGKPGKPGKMVTVFPAWKNPGILSFLPNILEK